MIEGRNAQGTKRIETIKFLQHVYWKTEAVPHLLHMVLLLIWKDVNTCQYLCHCTYNNMAEGSETVDKLFKVLVIGDLGVGKSSIILQYCKKRFDGEYKSTIGVDFTLKTIEWNEKTEVRLQLWDIGGECVKHSKMTFTLLTHLLQFDHNCWISLQECFHAWKLQFFVIQCVSQV